MEEDDGIEDYDLTEDDDVEDIPKEEEEEEIDQKYDEDTQKLVDGKGFFSWVLIIQTPPPHTHTFSCN